MTDIKSPEERSRNMSAIRSKNTKPEIYLRKLLFSRGYRYRLHSKNVPGHPDLYLAKYRTAIFVHGCFWHRHTGCRYAYTPKTRTDFWLEKFNRNIERDREVQLQLEKQEVKCLVVWECTINQMIHSEEVASDITKMICNFLKDSKKYMEL